MERQTKSKRAVRVKKGMRQRATEVRHYKRKLYTEHLYKEATRKSKPNRTNLVLPNVDTRPACRECKADRRQPGSSRCKECSEKFKSSK